MACFRKGAAVSADGIAADEGEGDGPNSWGPPPSHLMVVSCRMSMFPNMLNSVLKRSLRI